MGYMIEITEKKVDKLSEHLEEGLRHLGKAMSCVDEWMQDSGMGERRGYYGSRGGRYGNRYDEMEMRGGYGSRGSMGYRDEDEDWDDEEMAERRGRRRRDSRGRYM
jgi:hypothetical protein